MTTDEDATFGRQLRRLREAASLTQAELAERADLSPNAISALERGERTRPYPHTVRALAVALGLSAGEQATLAAAARGAPAARVEHRPLAPLLQPITPLFGREQDIERVVALLDAADHRLVTLIGPGGVGKTRLALAVAHVLADRQAGEVAFIDLAALRDPELVLPTIAHVLGVPESPAASLLGGRLVATLQAQNILLVLDNLEQVAAAGPALATLLAACPRLRCLITSRTALRVRGEQIYRVEPLPLPAPARTASAAVVASSPAVALFVARARSVRPDFALTDANAADITAICGRLDGLPLAIELAAVRIGVLSLHALRARLTSRLQVLTAGPRDLPARQQRLRDAIAWSHDLLTPLEQTVFRRFAVLAGGATVDAVTEIVGDDPSDLLDGVETLAAHSLLTSAVGDGGEPRFRMLETIREFAAERLAEAGEADAVRRRHAQFFRALAEDAAPHLGGADQDVWLDWLETDNDNLRAALDWAIDGQPGLALRLAVALSRFWFTRGYASEGRQWLERVLAAGDNAPTELRAAALAGAGKLAFQQGDLTAARALYEESLADKRVCGDLVGVASLLGSLGNVAREQGELTLATARYEESLVLHRQLGDDQGMASVLNNLGTTARYRGDLARAAKLHAESLAYRRRAGDTWGVAYTLTCLGHVAYEQGDLAAAARHLSEALALQRKLGDSYGTANTLAVLADVALAGGEIERAAETANESHELFQEHGDPWGIATSRLMLGRVAAASDDWPEALAHELESVRRFHAEGNLMGVASCFEALAAGAVALDQAKWAATLLAAAGVIRTARGTPVPLIARPWTERARHQAERMLGNEAFATAWAEGQCLAIEDAVALATAGLGDDGMDVDSAPLREESLRFGA